MDFEQYKQWRDDILVRYEVPSENRFDCLNPFKAMDFARRRGDGHEKSPAGGLGTKAGAEWRRLLLHGLDKDNLHFEPTRGVRSALGCLFERASQEGREVWLPEDVYPFYRKEASERAPDLDIRYFRTLPSLDLSGLNAAADNAVILVTDPLTPTGKFLGRPERSMLEAWTMGARDRWVVFDSVYLYDWRLPSHFRDGISGGRTIHLLSMSKSWLLRGVFGFAVGPEQGSDWWKHLGLLPDEGAESAALDALTSDPFMPTRQERVFAREWARRRGKLERFGAVTPKDGTGYFRRMNVNFERAFKENGLLLVPASVFGSGLDDWSVATCLYEASAKSSDITVLA